MKFFTDQTLGKLTKWLRLLGFDVVQIHLTPQKLLDMPLPQRETWILTRQTTLPQKSRRPDLVILTADEPEAQLTEICRRLNLSPETWEPLNRCTACNTILATLAPEQVEGRVPDYISQNYARFFECPQCHRVFWEGSHQQRIRRRLQELHHTISSR